MNAPKRKLPAVIELPDKTVLLTNGSKITAHINGSDNFMGFDPLKGIKDQILINACLSIPFLK